MALSEELINQVSFSFYGEIKKKSTKNNLPIEYCFCLAYRRAMLSYVCLRVSKNKEWYYIACV